MVEVPDTAQSNVVVLCVDANFFLPCAFLVEMLARDPERDRYDIAILYDGLSEAQLTRLSERAGRPILTLPVRTQDGRIVGQPADAPTLTATYFRLLMHRLLPEQYRRILYLDVDIAIERFEIASLFGLDLGDAAFAGARAKHYFWLLCPEVSPRLPKWRIERESAVAYLQGLGLDLGDLYVNAGVLLIDRARWTALDIPGRALAFARQHPERCVSADQSAINAVGKGHSAELSPRWNYVATLQSPEIDEAIRPVIRHFVGPFKPWNAAMWGEGVSGAYTEWLARSGWPGAFPAGPPGAAAATDRPRKRDGRFRRWLAALAGTRASKPGGTDAQGFALGPRRTDAMRHAFTAILTFGRFVDLDAAGRRALADAVVGSSDKRQARTARAKGVPPSGA